MSGRKKQTAAEITAEAESLTEAAEALEKANKRLLKAQQAQEQLNEDPNDLPEAPVQLSKLETLVANCNNEGTVHISIVEATGNSKVGVVSADSFEPYMEKIVKQKGGGTFRIEFRDGSGHIVGSATQSYDTDTYGSTKPVIPVNDNNGVMIQMMRMQNDNAERSARESREMMMSFQGMMLEMVKSNQTANPVVGGMGDVAGLFKMFREMNEKKSPFGDLKDLIGLYKAMQGEADDDSQSPMERMFNKAATMLTPTLEVVAAKMAGASAAQGEGLAPGAEQAVLPNTTVKAPTVASNPELTHTEKETPISETTPPLNSVDPVILGWAEKLLAAVSSGVEADSLAKMVTESVDSADDEKILREYIENPNAVGLLIEAKKELETHQQWLGVFFKATLNYLAEGWEDVPTEEPKVKTEKDKEPEAKEVVSV